MAEDLTKILNPDPYFSEYQMQENVAKWLIEKRFYKASKTYPYRTDAEVKIFREVRIPEIGRISDHIIYFSDRKIINLECKLTDITGVIKQANDHLKWADYSMICMPLELNYIPTKYIADIITLGIGLIYYKEDMGLFQFINPKHNKHIDKELRAKVVKRLNG